MTDKRKNKYIIDEPVIVLNGLVTDKVQYSNEQIKEFLKKKKIIKEKNIKNVSSPKKTRKIAGNINKRDLINNNNIIMLSEDSDSNEILKAKKNIKSPKKAKNQRNKKNKSTDEEESLYGANSVEKKKKSGLGDYKLKKNKININKKIHNIIVEDDDEEEKEDDSEEISSDNYNKNKIKDVFTFKSSIIKTNSIPKINYKHVEESYNYNEIKDICKNKSCTYISLFNSNELKIIIELNSSVQQLLKKIKNDEKEILIISEQNQEKNLINALDDLIKRKENKDNKDNKYTLFQKLKPDYNNILKYMPSDYSGVNNFGFMNIISYNGEDKIEFITTFFKDRTNKYILKFRKYILNLSSNNDNENIIYHIIIPKNNLKLIDINFNDKINLHELLDKLNCEYYLYAQQPGELLIVEPGSLHLSYYKKSKNIEKQDIYLLMFWNKMSIDSFYDYLSLKNDCLDEKYKYFPILTMLFNLINKKIKNLSDDAIKTIREIYNDMDSYENINKYIKDINDNNITFHKLFLNNIDLCNICQQELFNFYVYNVKDNDEITESKNNSCFLCINCAYKKNYFSIPKSIIFFKYPKEELDYFINKIFKYINKNKKDINNNLNDFIDDENDIISKCFDLNNREDDCINIDEFILKIDAPLKIIDKEYENNNFLSNKNAKVDKYFKFIENDKLNEQDLIDPLNKINFTNQIAEDDLYEVFKPKDYGPLSNNDLNIVSVIDNLNPNVDNKNERMNVNINMNMNMNEMDQNINDNIINVDSINSVNSFSLLNNRERDNPLEQMPNNNDGIRNPFTNRESSQNPSKKKKKKSSTVSDLIAGGNF